MVVDLGVIDSSGKVVDVYLSFLDVLDTRVHDRHHVTFVDVFTERTPHIDLDPHRHRHRHRPGAPVFYPDPRVLKAKPPPIEAALNGTDVRVTSVSGLYGLVAPSMSTCTGRARATYVLKYGELVRTFRDLSLASYLPSHCEWPKMYEACRRANKTLAEIATAHAVWRRSIGLGGSSKETDGFVRFIEREWRIPALSSAIKRKRGQADDEELSTASTGTSGTPGMPGASEVKRVKRVKRRPENRGSDAVHTDLASLMWDLSIGTFDRHVDSSTR